MARICTTISEKTENDLKLIATKTNKPFSKTVSEIIELGLISYKSSQKTEQSKPQLPTEFDLKNREYLLRILNIVSEILRKSYNEPSKCKEKTASLMLVELENRVKKYIESELNKA